MAVEITIPRLGWSMEEGIFIGWLKKNGERVRAGEPLFSLEGEKAAQDVESIDDGTLTIMTNGPAPGEIVLVGAIIGYLVSDGETPPASRPITASECAQTATGAAALSASRPGSRLARPRSSPLARRLAREHGIDWTRLVGTGSSGRIRKVDVLAAFAAGRAKVQPQATSAREDAAAGRTPPNLATRRLIAERMAASCRTTAPVTLTTTANATNLVALRDQFKAVDSGNPPAPSYTDFIVKLTALALRNHPQLNARWSDGLDPIVDPGAIHVGIAVDTEAGLVVPVIRDAAERGIRAVAACSRDLIARARGRQLVAAEMQDGTFTVSNLGAFGVETFTPIINLPQCAILGIGRIVRTPVMEGDRVAGQARMFLSLTFDHRIVDGAPAARFLQELVRLIENPSPSLMS